MLTNRLFITKLFFSLISLYFLSSFIGDLNLSLQSENTLDDESNYFSELIDDEITPLCKGLDIDYLEENSSISHIDINISNRNEWYENLFSLSFEPDRAIKLKYKKSYDATIKIIYSKYVGCEFNAIVKISGDWNDHIDKENLLSSLDVKLLDGNIYGITRFKLFLPQTRNNDNEIVVTSILNELNFITPRTFYVDVGIYNQSNNYVMSKFIFQEKPSKELIEHNQFREAPIYEVNESFFWEQILNGSVWKNKEKGLIPLFISKPLNRNWSSKGEPNAKITLKGLEKFNQAIFNSYDSETQLNYSFLGNNLEMLYMYDAANIALLAEHGMTNHNRRFFYNTLEEQFYPIYYDGNSNIIELGHVRGRSDYQDRAGLALGAKEILKKRKIDQGKFYEELLNKGLNISKDESNDLLGKFYNNLEEISKYKNLNELKNKNYFETLDLIVYDEELDFVFYNFENPSLESCDKNLLDCNYEEVNVELNELFSEKVKTTNNIGYLIGNTVESFLDTSLKEEKNIIYIDEVQIELFDNPKLKIDKVSKVINIFLDDYGQKVKFFGPGTLSDWYISISSDLDPKNQVSRIDENLLTGCLTFYNLEINNLLIDSNSMFCEDAINFVKVQGNNLDLKILNSSFDGLDADFSNIFFNNVTIRNSGNDCLDLSGGSYEIYNFIGQNCSDKGISIGEKAILKISKSDISNAHIGLAVKDSSVSEIININVKNVNLCIAAYRKKQEFGPSKILISNFECSAKFENFIQKGSLLSVGS